MVNVRVVAGLTGAVMGLLVALTLCAGPGADLAAAAQTPVRIVGTPVQAAQSAVVNMAALAREDAARPVPSGPSIVQVVPAPLTPSEPGASAPPFLPQLLPPAAGLSPQVPSPSPALDFAGLDDIANLSTGDRSIPPDTDGAVGLTKVMSGLNNNYRIFSKATGAVVSTVSTDTFWTAVGGSGFFDPKTLYDPINDRWLVVMLSDRYSADSSIDIGVSRTSDPSGSYYLFRVDVDATGLNWADFPTVGFNKDYVAVNVNMFPNAGGSDYSSKVLVLDYPLLRAGTSSAWFVTGSAYTSSPAATYSASESTLYVPTQPWGGGSYHVDTITKSGGAPVYTVGATKPRGVTWSLPGDNILPQKAPAAGGTPMGIESQDDKIRSTPVVRDGSIYYTQTVGLPSGGSLTRTSILWTKLTASTGNVADGGLIDDPTATATNGGKWYAYSHIAVNKYGDVIVGFSQFSSTQYASAGYAVRAAGDPAGTMRDPVVYKAGEDAYEKDYDTGRNRWGDYSKAQVDPSNDADLWVLNEYAKPVIDYGGVWGTWWGKVASPSVVPAPSITSFTPSAGPVGTSVTINGSGFAGASKVTFNGTAAVFSENSAAKITATVPSGASSGKIVVTTPGGTATSATSFTVTAPLPAPRITSFTPSSGPVGSTVTLTGTGFTGATKVAFHGAAATFSGVSATQITTTVPAGATTGTIAVTTPAGTGTSATGFTVIPAPTVSGFTPASGPVGTSVTLTGTGFSGATAVAFHGAAATYAVASATQITATVPLAATTGTITVTTPGGTAASATSFTVTVLPAAPTITSFTPVSGPVGTSVTLTGTGFSGATAVAFHGAAATFSGVSATQITATVPLTATSGTITVTTPGGSATSATSFTVTVPLFTPTVTLKLSGLKSGAVKLGKRLTAKGVVTPTSLAGSKVTLSVQKKKGAKWIKAKTTARTIGLTGAYSWKYKPAKKGAYRMRATIAKTSAHASAKTKWRTFKVK